MSAFARFFNSPTGPKTVHFWAPVLKWSLVIAGAKDFQRPVEKVSGTQQLALMATGIIWTRWCTVIRPRNYFLASVNFFLGTVALAQLGRIYVWQRSLGHSVGETLGYIVNPPVAKKEEPVAVEAKA